MHVVICAAEPDRRPRFAGSDSHPRELYPKLICWGILRVHHETGVPIWGVAVPGRVTSQAFV